LEEGEDKLVWVQRRKGTEQHTSRRHKKHSKRREGGVAQKGKGAAKWRMVKRTGKCSKRERESSAPIERKSAARERGSQQ